MRAAAFLILQVDDNIPSYIEYVSNAAMTSQSNSSPAFRSPFIADAAKLVLPRIEVTQCHKWLSENREHKPEETVPKHSRAW